MVATSGEWVWGWGKTSTAYFIHFEQFNFSHNMHVLFLTIKRLNLKEYERKQSLGRILQAVRCQEKPSGGEEVKTEAKVGKSWGQVTCFC